MPGQLTLAAASRYRALYSTRRQGRPRTPEVLMWWPSWLPVKVPRWR